MKVISVILFFLFFNFKLYSQFELHNVYFPTNCMLGASSLFDNDKYVIQPDGSLLGLNGYQLDPILYPQYYDSNCNRPYAGQHQYSGIAVQQFSKDYQQIGNVIDTGNSAKNCLAASISVLPNGDYIISGDAGTKYVHDGFFASLDTFDLPFIARTDANLKPKWMHGLNAKNPWLNNPISPMQNKLDFKKEFIYAFGTIYDSVPSFNINLGYNDIFIIKYDLEGNELWRNVYGGKYDDELSNIVFDKYGGIYCCGTTASRDNDMKDDNFYKYDTLSYNLNYMVMKIDVNGNNVWTKVFGGTDKEVINYSFFDLEKNKIVTLGSTPSNDCDLFNKNKGGYDIGLAVLDTSGKILWINSYGTSKTDYPNGITKNYRNGNYVLACQTVGDDKDFNDRKIPISVLYPENGYILEVNANDGSIVRKQRVESNKPETYVHYIFTLPDSTIRIVGYVDTTGCELLPPNLDPDRGFIADLLETDTTTKKDSINIWLAYPNPTIGNLILENKLNNNNVTIVLLNPLGQQIISINGKQKITLDISQLPSGIYIIQIIEQNHKSQQIKIIKT